MDRIRNDNSLSNDRKKVSALAQTQVEQQQALEQILGPDAFQRWLKHKAAPSDPKHHLRLVRNVGR